METLLIWLLTASLILIGFVGIIVPILPGTTLIFVAMVIHKLLLPGDISWAMIGWIGGFWLFSVLLDFGGVIIGTRLFGGSKWGMAGAGGGAFIGMFFSLPMLIIGTIVGAMAAEKLVAKKTNRQSLMAGAGAAVGFVISTVGRALCAVVMIGLFLLAVWQAHQVAARGVEIF